MPDHNPVVLITGAARRIGAATAKLLHHNGYNIALHYNQSHKEAKALVKQLNDLRSNSAAALHADLNNITHTQALAHGAYSKWGRLDALVNNASSFFPTPLGECTEEHWDNLVNSNLKAPFFLAQACIDYLKISKGKIINIADVHAERPLSDHSIYCMAKAGNVMLTKSLAKDLAPNIQVNGIAPGAIAWPEDNEGNEIPDNKRLESIPLKRLGGTESISSTILFLLEHATYTTGQILTVDGGKTLNQ